MTTTKVSKWGGAHGIRLPKAYMNNLKISENDTVELYVVNDSIVIKKQPHQHKSFKKRIEEFYGMDFDTVVNQSNYEGQEWDTGNPVGDEVF